MRRRKNIPESTRQASRHDARVRALAAIGRVRRGESGSLSAAASAEGTTVRTIRRLIPAALVRGRSGGRIRIKAGDPYSASVEIVTRFGPVVVNARGSRQRELAGRHRAVWLRVLKGIEPPFRPRSVSWEEAWRPRVDH
jgi:hypothetical protein